MYHMYLYAHTHICLFGFGEPVSCPSCTNTCCAPPQVAVFAGALRARGIRKGDCVLIYLPMVPEAFVAMLACARIGAVHRCCVVPDAEFS